MARLLQSAESLGTSTSTSATPVDKITNVVSVVAGQSYALFWSFQPSSNDTSSVIIVRLRDSTGAADLGHIRWASKDTTDLPIQGGVGVFTAASTASRTFAIDYARNSGTGTVGIANARLIVLELGPNDGFVSAVGQISTSSTTFVDAATATWTATAGDYLMLMQGSVGNNGTEVRGLTPGGTAVNAQLDTQLINTSFGGWAAAWVETQSAGSKTAKVQYRSTTGSGVNLRGMAVVSINLADLRGAQTAQTSTPHTGTETTYQTAATLAATGLAPVARPTLFIAAAALRNNSTTVSVYQEIREDGVQLVEGPMEARGSTTVNTASSVFAKLITANDSAITFDIRRKSETSAATSTVVSSMLAVLELYETISGAASLTEADDGMSATGALYITATGAITEAGDSLSAAGALAIKGTAALSEADDAVASTIQFTPILATAALLEADDSLAATGAIAITGATAVTEADDVLTATGAVYIVAAGSMVEADDTLSSAAALAIHGTLAQTEADDSLVAAGAVAITGAADIYEDDDSVEASDFVPRGRADLIEDDDHIRAAGEIPASWMQEQATRGDIPNWNHCARCYKEVRPNELIRQTRRTGSSITWTGIYVCNDCLDPIHPQDRWPRKMAGDPKPVPNARPWKGS